MTINVEALTTILYMAQMALLSNSLDSDVIIFSLFSEPYTPTGNFEVDFCELCTRAGFPTMQVVPRPHRPPTPSVIPQDSTPVGKQDKKDGRQLC